MGKNKFSRIYTFGHNDNVTSTEYIQLHAEGLNVPLEVSKEHLLFVMGYPDPVPASMVVVNNFCS